MMSRQKKYTVPEEIKKGFIFKVLEFIYSTLIPSFIIVMGVLLFSSGSAFKGILIGLVGLVGLFLLPLLKLATLRGHCPKCGKELPVLYISFGSNILKFFYPPKCNSCKQKIALKHEEDNDENKIELWKKSKLKSS